MKGEKESMSKLDEQLNVKSDTASNKSVQGEDPIDNRIKTLDNALKSAKEAIEAECKSNGRAIFSSSVLCSIIVVGGFFFGCNLYKDAQKIPEEWTWQIIYLTAIRLTICAALFSFASFCFKLLRSYLHIYQINKHRKVILNSMAGLVEAANRETRNAIFHRLLDIIIKFSNTGFLSKENDFKPDTITNAIAKVAEKKK